MQGNKNDLTTRLLLTEEDVNRDLSNLTLVGPETQARLEALLAAAGKCFNDKPNKSSESKSDFGKMTNGRVSLSCYSTLMCI